MDWNKFNQAMKYLADGNHSSGEKLLRALDLPSNSAVENSILALAEANCAANANDTLRAHHQIEKARRFLGDLDPLISSQIDLVEATLNHYKGDYQLAHAQFCRIKETYRAILADPAHRDFLLELKTRHSITLAHMGLHAEAISAFRELIREVGVEEQQQLNLYCGTSLAAMGASLDAISYLRAAACGPDRMLGKQAMLHLERLRVPD